MTDQTPPAAPAEEEDLPEQMRVRLEKRERLLESGRPAYPLVVARTHTLKEIREKFDPLMAAGDLEADTRTGEQVAVAGRAIFLRNTGKLCFARLREGDGTELQVMLSLADVGQEQLDEF
ncbi:MAG TPA: lysine--tRNA ligase, partial [Nocardioidaceae bacterium]|nr:lysine--tRNA ligase [Nocardioidaceae bacterium]